MFLGRMDRNTEPKAKDHYIELGMKKTEDSATHWNRLPEFHRALFTTSPSTPLAGLSQCKLSEVEIQSNRRTFLRQIESNPIGAGVPVNDQAASQLVTRFGAQVLGDTDP